MNNQNLPLDNEVIVTLKGAGLSYEQSTNLQKAGQIISFLSLDQASVRTATAYEVAPSGPTLLAPKRIQPHEAISSSKAKTYAQKIAVLGMYLRDQANQATFSPQEIRLIFKKIGDEPRNFGRDFKNAVELQYLVCVDENTEQYQLTVRGEEAVMEGFASEPTPKKSPNSKRISNPRVSEGVKQMSVTSSLDGFPNYHDIPTKGDKILWILAYADSQGIQQLTPGEVDHLSNLLRDRIESKGFTALNERNVKKAYITKTAEGFRIQQKGLEYVRSLKSGIASGSAAV